MQRGRVIATGMLVWLPLAWSLWDRLAVLQPYASIDIGDERARHSYSRSGHIIVAGRRLVDDPSSKSQLFATYGPVEFYSTRDGSKLFERFSATDQVFSLEVSPDTVTVIRRDDKVWVADLETGELLARLPDDDKPHFHHRAGENRVLMTDDAGIRCYDYVAGQDAWRFATGRLKLIQAMTPTHAIVFGQSATTGKEESTAVRLTDGHAEELIGRPGTFSIEEHSGDGCSLVLRTIQPNPSGAETREYLVFDLVTQKARSFLKGVSGYTRAELAFSPDDSEIRAFVPKDGRIEMGRLRVSDGEMLDDSGFRLLASGARFPETVSVSNDHRWALGRQTIIDEARWRSVQDVVKRVRKFFGQKYMSSPAPSETALYELPSGRKLGVVLREWPERPTPGGPHSSFWLSPKSECLMLQPAGERVVYLYSTNARRDWKSQVAVVVVPPAVVVLLVRVIAGWRRRRALGRRSATESVSMAG